MGEKRARQKQEQVHGTPTLQLLQRLRRLAFPSSSGYLPLRDLDRSIRFWHLTSSYACVVAFWGMLIDLAVWYFLGTKFLPLDAVVSVALPLWPASAMQERRLRSVREVQCKPNK